MWLRHFKGRPEYCVQKTVLIPPRTKSGKNTGTSTTPAALLQSSSPHLARYKKKEISKCNSILLCSLEWKIICMLPLLMVQNHKAETKQGIQIWTFVQTPPSGFSSLLEPRLEGTYFLCSGRLAFSKASSNPYTLQLKSLGGESQLWLPQTRLANLTGYPQTKPAPGACSSALSLWGAALPADEPSSHPGTAPLQQEDGSKLNPEEYTKIWLYGKAKLWLSVSSWSPLEWSPKPPHALALFVVLGNLCSS